MCLDDVCNTTLVLGLGLTSNNDHKKMNKPIFKVGGNFESCLSLGLSDGHNDYKESVTSMVQNGVVVKRECEDAEKERASCKGSDVDDDRGSNNNIKKLTLNKNQSLVLEENFKLHRTLNHKQKQELARKLNMRARQIEVWFQNRRARTKVKQTQVDSEYLKKCYETLTEENRRLKKELQELKALELARPLYTRMPASATLTMCPSCETISGNGQRG